MAKVPTLREQATKLINLYVKLWEDKYGKKPIINRFKYQYPFQDMIQDLGFEEASRVVGFYFRTGASGHTLDGLVYKYDEIYKGILAYDEYEAKAATLREETRRRVAEHERRTESN